MNTIPHILKTSNDFKKINSNIAFKVINNTKFKTNELFTLISDKGLLKIEDKSDNAITINLDEGLSKEEYKIKHENGSIHIFVGEYTGFVRAMSSIIQFMFFEEIPTEAHDNAKYSWRGVSWDLSRHFFNKDEIMKQMFIMFIYKINILQLHLTDDQGWRLEIKSLPKLTEKGSIRKENDEFNGGFLTHEDVKEIVALGKTLSIEIIPEIDMPGHTLALIYSYPELLCEGFSAPEFLETKFGVSSDVVCISNPKVNEVFKTILNEVVELFDNSDIVHIGGDECPSGNWTKCPNCIKAQNDKGFETPYQLQKEFAKDMINYLATKGKRVLCWDDLVAEEKIDNVIVECWREWEMKKEGYCDELIESGVEFVNMANEHTYWDWYQDENEPRAEKYYGWLTPQEKAYDFEPTKYVLKEENKAKIKGAACGVWTERIEDVERLEYQIYPRTLIMANTLWQRDYSVDWKQFQDKLKMHYKLLDKLNVHYFKKDDKYLKLKQTTFKIMGEEHVENLKEEFNAK